MAVLSGHFAQETMSMAHVDEEIAGRQEIHPTAIIHSSAKIGRGVRIGAHCVVEADVTLGEGTILYPGVYVGTQSRLGTQCILYPRVSVYEKVVMGSRVRIHAGAVIGADGFGYAPMVRDGKVSGHQKIYHCGGVLIEDDVEIGANACVDRGTFGDTKLGRFVKIDNMVQIGHNAVLDEGAVVCGSAALAGSSSLGKYSYIGGLTGISNKVHVGDYAKVGALSLMTKDVPAGTAAVGNPQREYREHFRAHAEINRLIKRRRDV
jgi:UDP-3-O-[3-hydroxymyristoyl] glucosamine N-acyltransferase